MPTDGEARKLENAEVASDRFTTKSRLNLNDLLRRRSEEKKVDKKTNLIILSSVSAVALIVLLILNL
tara:strand:- start:293 stop:493 length:201 start_codon:yes stop_codon:yes gene_type:complete